jgi:hypothetical protein
MAGNKQVTFQRRHFEFIAEAIKTMRLDSEQWPKVLQVN